MVKAIWTKMKQKIMDESRGGEEESRYAFFEKLGLIDFRDDLSYK